MRIKFQARNASPVGMVRFLMTRRFIKFFAAMCFVDSLPLQFFLGVMAPFLAYGYQATPTDVAKLVVTFGLGMIFSMAVLI